MALDLSQMLPSVTVETVQPVVVVAVEAADITVDCTQQVVDVHSPCNVVEVVSGGPMGPPGVVDGETLVLPAAETIHAHRAVRVADGALAHPSVLVAAHAGAVVGVAEQSGTPSTPISVRTRGRMRETGWSWSPGYVWCGDGGVLTQSPGPGGWALPVGHAIDAQTIDIDVGTPVLRI